MLQGAIYWFWLGLSALMLWISLRGAPFEPSKRRWLPALIYTYVLSWIPAVGILAYSVRDSQIPLFFWLPSRGAEKGLPHRLHKHCCFCASRILASFLFCHTAHVMGGTSRSCSICFLCSRCIAADLRDPWHTPQLSHGSSSCVTTEISNVLAADLRDLWRG